MSKRFPIPPFAYEHYKNMEWTVPQYRGAKDQARLLDAALSGDRNAYGAYPVQADAAFYDRFRLQGEQRHAVMCVLPAGEVSIVGRSHAWAIQQALIVDSLDASRAKVLFEWNTPRPMNTRLGPDNGVVSPGGVLYVICSHRYADYWIVNRTLVEDRGFAGESGFGVLSASDDTINDFHACNVWFHWQ
jgi:hypothetical protein